MATAESKLEKDMVHLARVALSGRPQDVMALLHRFAKFSSPVSKRPDGSNERKDLADHYALLAAMFALGQHEKLRTDGFNH